MRAREVMVGALTLLMLASAGQAGAASRSASRCLFLTDEAHDEEPPPQEIGFDAGSLDVLSLRITTDPQVVRMTVTVRSLSQPVQPPGQNVSYRVFWVTRPPEQPEARFSLDAELDGALTSFTLGMSQVDTRSPATGDSYTQLGGALTGAVDTARRTVTVDVPRNLLAPYTRGSGRVMRDVAFSAWHGIGNPMIAAGGRVILGSSGYRRITDRQTNVGTVDLTAPRCRY